MSNIAIMQTQLAQKKSPNFPNCTRKTLNCKVNTAWWTPPDRIRRSQNCSRTQLPLLVHRKSLQHLISNYMVIPENGAIAPSSSSSSSNRNERFNFLWNSPSWPSVVARKNGGREESWLTVIATVCSSRVHCVSSFLLHSPGESFNKLTRLSFWVPVSAKNFLSTGPAAGSWCAVAEMREEGK